MADLVTIKKIRTAAGDHLIDATYLGGHTFSDIQGMVHGVVDTYVIPASNSTKTGYGDVVESTASELTTTKTILNGLVTPANASGVYKLGDIILMGASSDGVKRFDRWISAVSGDNVTLSVLETQVAKHHHTVGVTAPTAKALTGANPTTTTNAIPTVGAAVTVLTGTSGEVVTSVSYDDKGKNSLAIATATSTDGIGHSHTVNAHSHTVKFTPSTLVSQTASAYTTLTSANYTPHTHTNATVAGTPANASNITYVTSGSTDTFIKTLTDSSAMNTGGKALTTEANTGGLTTSTQTSADTIGSDVLTLSGGAHTHTVTTTTTENVVKSVNLAANVITSVKLNYTAPSVQANVVTAVTYTSTNVVSSVNLTGTTTFFSNCSVDNSGVLSFVTASVGVNAPTKTVASAITVNSGSQSAGSASVSAPSATQTYTSGTVAASGSAASAGAHQHGFSHTHAIPAHTHGVAAHNHTYVKTVASTTGSAYTSFKTSTYTPHTHGANVTVAGAHSDGTAIKYITGGSTTDVVRNLKSSEQSYTSTTTAPGTDIKYYKLSGDITFPGLTLGKKTLSTTTVTPAVAGTEKPIKSITYNSSNFVTGVTVNNGGKTSTNIGGE